MDGFFHVYLKLGLHGLLLVDRQQAVIDLKGEDRQGRVGQPPARGRVVILEEPAAGFMGETRLLAHDLVAVSGVPSRPHRMIHLEERL